MIQKLFEELSAISQVEAIALGGSRAGDIYDEKSDYDVYLYCNGFIEEDVRRNILQKYCRHMELGNHFWEYEDNCVLNNGIDMDILYRNLDDFVRDVAEVAEKCQTRNSYTTCMWHNLRTCKVIYDRDGRLQKSKERFSVPYPQQLKKNIIENGMKLLQTTMPAYEMQIAKAVKRGDLVSVNHRTAAFLETYFDILFAVNEQTHPGEKRLMQLCRRNCQILPERFEENMYALFRDLFTHPEAVIKDVAVLIEELEKLL